MAARRRYAHRKPVDRPGVSGANPERENPPVRDSGRLTGDTAFPTGRSTQSTGSLPFAVVLEIIAREYSGEARDEKLCRIALQLAEESGQLESYRARWDEEESAPDGSGSSLLFDRKQCLELINYYESTGRMEKLKQEKKKLAQIEGRLLLGGGAPTHITNEDLDKLEEFIKQAGF